VKINYTLWGTGLAGGTRNIFETANRLVDRGHDITITSLEGDHSWFPLKVEVNYVELPKVFEPLRPLYKMAKHRDIRYSDAARWLSLLRFGVDLIKPLAATIPKCDVNVATFCLTAYSVHRSGKGLPFYYIQHYEPLFFSDTYLRNMAEATYYLPLRKLVVSRWLEETIYGKTGERPVCVGNALWGSYAFYPRAVGNKLEEKTVMAFFRGIEWKGEREVIEAMNMVSRKLNNVKLLGVGNKDAFERLIGSIPIHFKFEIVNAPDDDELAELYSLSDVFVSASWYEGFGAPQLEAMACGTPVVTTDSGGVRDYAVNGRNAYVVPPKEPEKLADAIIKVLSDEKMRLTFRNQGLETAKEFTWKRVVDRVEQVFESALRH